MVHTYHVRIAHGRGDTPRDIWFAAKKGQYHATWKTFFCFGPLHVHVRRFVFACHPPRGYGRCRPSPRSATVSAFRSWLPRLWARRIRPRALWISRRIHGPVSLRPHGPRISGPLSSRTILAPRVFRVRFPAVRTPTRRHATTRPATTRRANDARKPESRRTGTGTGNDPPAAAGPIGWQGHSQRSRHTPCAVAAHGVCLLLCTQNSLAPYAFHATGPKRGPHFGASRRPSSARRFCSVSFSGWNSLTHCTFCRSCWTVWQPTTKVATSGSPNE